MRFFLVDEVFVEEAITPESYARLKAKYEAKLHQGRLERSSLEEDSAGLAEQLQFAVRLFSNLGSVYQRADLEGKHERLVRIFLDGLLFSARSFRTHGESDNRPFSRKIEENRKRRSLERLRRLVW